MWSAAAASAIRGRAGMSRATAAPITAASVDLLWQSDAGNSILFQNDNGDAYHLAVERHRGDRQQQSRQPRADLAHQGGGRLLRQRRSRSPMAERQRRRLHLGDQRNQRDRRRQPRQSGAELAHRRHRRLQRRRPFRHPVAERQRRRRDLGDERHQRDRRRQRRQPRPDLARRRHRRLQPRRLCRHPVAERQRRRRDLGDERHQRDRRRQHRQPRARPGTSRGPAISSATAIPTSSGRTTMARSRSGK